MKTRIAGLLMVCVVMSLGAGCTGTAITKERPVPTLPERSIPIRLTEENVSVRETYGFADYSVREDLIVESIKRASKGTISPEVDSPLDLYIEYKGSIRQGTDPKYNAGFCLGTLFVLPSLIPNLLHQYYDYKLEYEVKDGTRAVTAGFVDGSTEYAFQGWFLLMIEPMRDAMRKAGALTVTNVGRQVVADVYSPSQLEKMGGVVRRERKKVDTAAAERSAAREAERKKQATWEKAREMIEEDLANENVTAAMSKLKKVIAKGVGGDEARELLVDVYNSPAWEETRPKVTLQKFEVRGDIPQELEEFLYDALLNELVVSGKYTVVDWAEVDKLLAYFAESEPNISEEDARSQALDQLGVSQMVIGSAYKIGSKYYVSAKMLNLDLSVAATFKESVKSVDGFEEGIKRITGEMLLAD